MTTEPTEREHYTLHLAAGNRKWINANQRVSWMARYRMTRDWRELAQVRALYAHLPYCGPSHVVCELLFADVRRRDPNNWSPTAKAVIDGLVDAHVFTDDDAKNVLGPDMRLGPKVIGANVGLMVHIYPQGSTQVRCPHCAAVVARLASGQVGPHLDPRTQPPEVCEGWGHTPQEEQ